MNLTAPPAQPLGLHALWFAYLVMLDQKVRELEARIAALEEEDE